MPTNVPVPPLGESVNEAVLLRWIKNDGEAVKADEPIAELETDKANVDLPAPKAGVLRHAKKVGETVKVGESVGVVDENATPSATPAKPAAATAAPATAATAAGKSSPAPTAQGYGNAAPVAPPAQEKPVGSTPEDFSPAVRKMIAENNLDPATIQSSGPNGRLTKEDVQAHLDKRSTASAPAPAPAAPAQPQPTTAKLPTDGERRVPMTKIRKRIAENLVRAQQTAAILTTFNEIDLTEMMALRGRYKEQFEKKHGIGLGMMSFFVRAVVLALKEYPGVNAFLDGEDVIYHDFVHMGIAVSTDRGLAVPVLRNAHNLSFAKIESEIKRLATSARDGKLALDELSGGTFTITNGGVFGSLLSTPILNPPQSGILGMHTIQKRPMVINDEIKVRQMMYVALSYDHRIVDGRESVSFLVRVKQYLEDPARLMLEV